MHRLNYVFATIIACFLAISCCPEKPPTIVPCQTDRVVLVEEFTGMKCVNCPSGHRKIKELQQTYPNKIVPVAIHSHWPVYSAPQNGYDFRTADGEIIEKDMKASNLPSAMVNRKYFEESGVYALEGFTNWAGSIAAELCLPPDATIQLNPTYDDNNRKVTVTVDVAPTNAVRMKERVGLTVLITESHIIAPQEGLSGWDYNYEHNHVLRDVITDTWGTKIQEKGETLTPHQEVLTYTLPTDWNPDNCHLVAFVHYQGDERYVLQAAEADLVP